MFCSLPACFGSSIITSGTVGGGTAMAAAIMYKERYFVHREITEAKARETAEEVGC